jgi:hypothetical protein
VTWKKSDVQVPTCSCYELAARSNRNAVKTSSTFMRGYLKFNHGNYLGTNKKHSSIAPPPNFAESALSFLHAT